MVDSSSRDDAPTRLREYRVLRRLGAGGMGEVQLAYDERLGRPVALKRVRADAVGDVAWQARFHREARAAAQLSHPHIVQIYDLLDDETGSVIVMEHVEGETVAARLAAGRLPVTDAVRIARQVADGLAAAHDAGLVHRDLKPQNVMLTPRGHAKILDFGLARPVEATSEVTDAGAVVGTFRSMAPEQARGEAVGPAADLFSLGVLLYEMLTGVSPFAASTPLETLERVARQAAPPLAVHGVDVPPALDALVDDLLAKVPADRPADANAVVDRLAAVEGTTRASATTSGEADPIAFGSQVTAPTPPSGHGASWQAGSPASPVAATPSGHGGASAAPVTRSPGRSPARRYGWLALVLLVVAVAVVGLRSGRTPSPLRVLVVPTALETAEVEGSAELALLASGVTAAVLRGVTGLRGLVAVDPAEVAGHAGPLSAQARAVAADVVVQGRIEHSALGTWLTLSRLDDGAVQWTDRFPVASQSGDAVLVARAVATRLREAFPRHRPRDDVPALDARAADYAAFVAVFQRLERGSEQLDEALARLDEVLVTSPRFFDAARVAASTAFSRYRSGQRSEDLARAEGYLERARMIAPHEPTVLALAIQMALARGDAAAAGDRLATLEAVAPSHPVVPLSRSRIAEHAGRLAEAAGHLAAAPATWRNLWRRADLALRQGRVDEGREHLTALLARWPENAYARNRLAQLELMWGDLERAEVIYEGLTRTTPHRSHWTNLGLVRYLRGDYPAAVESYRRALAVAPGHITVLFNLAEAELELGEVASAVGHCREVLTKVDAKRAEGLTPSLNERLARAHCLARLERPEDAANAVFDVIRAHPEDADVQVQAAAVFAVAGETASALACLRAAVDLGTNARWLEVPAFAGLRDDPTYQALTAAARAPQPPP